MTNDEDFNAVWQIKRSFAINLYWQVKAMRDLIMAFEEKGMDPMPVEWSSTSDELLCLLDEFPTEQHWADANLFVDRQRLIERHTDNGP